MNKQNHTPLSILLTILSAMVIFSVNTSHAADVTLSWTKPDDSRVVGYHIYCGISGTNYTASPAQTINSPDLTSCLIPNLEEGQTYEFKAKSFDSGGNESEFSETINYLIPLTPSDIDGDGYTVDSGDCNDNNAAVHPGAIEICNDGIDQNCDGIDCYQAAADIDSDGDGYTENEGDCNDSDATAFPGAIEICGDGIDQDCNGSDLACPEDVDNDGDGYTENGGDLNDNSASIYPGAVEICGDDIDQDCDGSDLVCISIEGVTLSWTKPEDDRVVGYNVYCGKTGTEFKLTPYVKINSADTTSYSFTNLETGFEYSFAATSIDADGIESDFSETITYFVGDSGDPDSETQTIVLGDTMDSDHQGSIIDTFININQEVNYASDQLNTYTWPANMPANAILLQVDLSQIPAGAQIQNATLSLYQTAAGGDASYDVKLHKIVGHKPDLYQTNGYTYDGANNWTANTACYNGIPLAQADIAPTTNVNSLDQNLGYKTWVITAMMQEWVNNANSNYGLLLNSDAVAGSDSYRTFASSETADAAQRPRIEVTYTVDSSSTAIDNDGDGYTVAESDCNDNDASIHPGAVEICGDGIDQDCNGSDLTCPEDIDNDGDGHTENDGDCNDNDAAIYPGAIEICGDGIDQDCNGSDLICPEDLDNDSDGFAENNGDCNDNDATIYPGATEICGDGIDQDCDGSDLTCPEDIDNDGDGHTENDGDCNDNDASLYPGAIEICGDGIDQDCDGSDLECIPEEQQDIAMELGEIKINHIWTSVTFDKAYTNPVVVATPISLNDSAPAVVRIKNVSTTGFEIRVQEYNYLDGNHGFETVSYMVMEAGKHTLPNGINIEAGTFNANSRKKVVSFNQTFKQIPVVISGVTTENDRDAVAGRTYGITSGAFNFVLQEQETTKTRHYTYETISYIAWEPSSGTVNGMSYIVDSTLNQVTQNFYNIPFYPSFTDAPLFMADMQTSNNADTANVRWQNKSADAIDVQIDEEQSKDLEVSHIAEVVGYMAFSPGL